MNEKPLELVRLEFLESVVKLVNESGLPAFVMLDVLKDLTSQLSTLAAQQLEEAKRQYQEVKVDEDRG